VESATYRVAAQGDTFTQHDFELCDYDRLNGSRVHYVKFLSGRVAIEPSLRENPLFASHVDPLPGSPPAILVRVRPLDQEKPQHQRMILLCDGCIACDCKDTYQQGFWCRHDWALWARGLVDFTPNLCIASYYGKKGCPDGLAVHYSVEGSLPLFRVTKPWNFAPENTVVGVGDLTHAVFSPAEQKVAEAGNKQVSETAARKSRLFDVAAGANSASLETRKAVDSLVLSIEELLAADAKLARVNKGKTAHLNPLPKNRNVLELAVNKSDKF
jgi:hypothetical protein